MLSKETLERYRKMTPGERLGLTLQAIRQSQKYLGYGSQELVARRFELLKRDNDARNDALLAKLMEPEARKHEYGCG